MNTSINNYLEFFLFFENIFFYQSSTSSVIWKWWGFILTCGLEVKMFILFRIIQTTVFHIKRRQELKIKIKSMRKSFCLFFLVNHILFIMYTSKYNVFVSMSRFFFLYIMYLILISSIYVHYVIISRLYIHNFVVCTWNV